VWGGRGGVGLCGRRWGKVGRWGCWEMGCGGGGGGGEAKGRSGEEIWRSVGEVEARGGGGDGVGWECRGGVRRRGRGVKGNGWG